MMTALAPASTQNLAREQEEPTIGTTLPSGRVLDVTPACTRHAAPRAAGHGAVPVPQSTRGPPLNEPRPEKKAPGAALKERGPNAT